MKLILLSILTLLFCATAMAGTAKVKLNPFEVELETVDLELRSLRALYRVECSAGDSAMGDFESWASGTYELEVTLERTEEGQRVYRLEGNAEKQFRRKLSGFLRKVRCSMNFQLYASSGLSGAVHKLSFNAGDLQRKNNTQKQLELALSEAFLMPEVDQGPDFDYEVVWFFPNSDCLDLNGEILFNCSAGQQNASQIDHL